MANPEHVKKLNEGRVAWNVWRDENAVRPVLSRAQIQDMTLGGYNLTRTDFWGAELDNVIFEDASCNNSSFRGARFFEVTFRFSSLFQCDFSDSHIAYSTFHQCTLDGSNFDGATLLETALADVSLQNAHGLSSMDSHDISIGLDTFFSSAGLPERMLRGSKVPEEFIQYASSLVGRAIEYYSCFLSYSSKDDEFARRLYNDLQGKSVRTWFAPEDLKIGDRFRPRIDEAIRFHDKLVLVLSAASVASDWVETEVESALEREQKEGKDVLFPIAIDDEGFESQQSWARMIRHKRHIGDFRNWKSHDDYQKRFEKLVADLKRSQPTIIMKGG